jgi:hypothetical protein
MAIPEVQGRVESRPGLTSFPSSATLCDNTLPCHSPPSSRIQRAGQPIKCLSTKCSGDEKEKCFPMLEGTVF